MNRADEFFAERKRLNEVVMKYAGQPIKRFFSLDGQVYRQGALDEKTKELMGLAASLVLRCDDCIRYHVIRSFEKGASDGEFEETAAVGLVVDGSIVIPHLRRAFDLWDELKREYRRSND